MSAAAGRLSGAYCSVAASSSSPTRMPSMKTSLLTAIPWGLALLPGWCSAGVRREMATRAPEKIVSAPRPSAPAPAGQQGAPGGDLPQGQQPAKARWRDPAEERQGGGPVKPVRREA
jgi:hypothetical protein